MKKGTPAYYTYPQRLLSKLVEPFEPHHLRRREEGFPNLFLKSYYKKKIWFVLHTGAGRPVFIPARQCFNISKYLARYGIQMDPS